MAEKRPGLLKRIFSFGFGSRKTAEPEPELEPESRQDTPAEAPAQQPPAAVEQPAAPAPAQPAVAPELPESVPAPTPPVSAPKAPEPSVLPEATEPAKESEPAQPPGTAAARAELPAEIEPLPQAEAQPPEADREAAKTRPSKRKPSPPPKSVAKPSPEPTVDARKKSQKSGRPAVRETPPPPAVPDPVAAPEISKSAAPVTEEPAEAQKEETAPVASPVAKEPELPAEVEQQSRREGWFRRLRKGLTRSSDALVGNVAAIFTKRRLDEATLQELEDVLIQADLGIEAAMAITDALSAKRLGREVTDSEIRQVMAEEIEKVLTPVALPLELDLTTRPHVILVIGVNGSGKTTTIGKLAAKLRGAGYATMLVAGDTFRAAAIEQLSIWGERTGSPVVARQLGADAAGLAFDAYRQAAAEDCDVMIMDTAGRLQNKKELMAELEKIVRVLKKQDPGAPHTVLLTLDATTGQNALSQVEIFKDVAGVNGLVMTKLDGTARGGILVAIASKFGLPVYFVGVGEQVEDLEPFEARDFANSIAGLESEAAEAG
jgi:fused signal recognition particle receptor